MTQLLRSNFFPAFLPGFFMKIRQCMLFQTVSCNNGRLSFFVGLSEIHVFLAFGVDSLAGGSFAGEPPKNKNGQTIKRLAGNDKRIGIILINEECGK